MFARLHTSTMALSHQERTLRVLTVLAWIPAMALLIPFGVMTHTIVPALGLIPMTFSAVLGLAKLYDYIRTDFHILTITIYTFTMDAIITLLLLGFTIPGYVHMAIPELGTFASMPLLSNTYALPLPHANRCECRTDAAQLPSHLLRPSGNRLDRLDRGPLQASSVSILQTRPEGHVGHEDGERRESEQHRRHAGPTSKRRPITSTSTSTSTSTPLHLHF